MSGIVVRTELVKNKIRDLLTRINVNATTEDGSEKFKFRQGLVDGLLAEPGAAAKINDFCGSPSCTSIIVSLCTGTFYERYELSVHGETTAYDEPYIPFDASTSVILVKEAGFDEEDSDPILKTTNIELTHSNPSTTLNQLMKHKIQPACSLYIRYSKLHIGLPSLLENAFSPTLEKWYGQGPAVMAEVDSLLRRNADLGERVVSLLGPITLPKARTIAKQIRSLIQKDRTQPIDFHINSGGGAVDAAMLIYDAMQEAAAQQCIVRTICIDEAYSMASMLLVAGSKGERYAMEGSKIMVHNLTYAPSPHSISSLSSTHLQNEAAMIAKTLKEVNTIYSRHLGRPADLSTLVADQYFNPEEAKTNNLIDAVRMRS